MSNLQKFADQLQNEIDELSALKNKPLADTDQKFVHDRTKSAGPHLADGEIIREQSHLQ